MISPATVLPGSTVPGTTISAQAHIYTVTVSSQATTTNFGTTGAAERYRLSWSMVVAVLLLSAWVVG